MRTRDLIKFKAFLEERYHAGAGYNPQVPDLREIHQKLTTEIAFRQVRSSLPYMNLEKLAKRFNFHDYSSEKHRKSHWKAAIAEASRINSIMCGR